MLKTVINSKTEILDGQLVDMAIPLVLKFLASGQISHLKWLKLASVNSNISDHLASSTLVVEVIRQSLDSREHSLVEVVVDQGLSLLGSVLKTVTIIKIKTSESIGAIIEEQFKSDRVLDGI